MNPLKINKLFLKIRYFLTDIRGIGAVEFCLAVPFMIVVWMGTVELSRLELVSRKVSVAAQTVADLVAQESNVSEADLNSIIAVGRMILEPFPADGMKVKIISVEADVDGDTSVGWEFPVDEGSSIPPRSKTLVTQNESVIVVIVKYKATGMFAKFERNIIEEFYTRPRKVRIIPFNTE
jgi:Flp pilus assembly protein TadG